MFSVKTCAFIPARSNSKRVAGKNAKKLGGEPLIYYTIKAALESSVDMTYFSTEDPKLAEMANDIAFQLDKSGTRFDVLLRDPALAQDHVQTDEVYLSMLRKLEYVPELQSPQTLVLLQPTSPRRTARHINEALELWKEKQAGCLFSGFKISGFLWSLGTDGAEPIDHDPRFRLGAQWTQGVEHAIENGAIYIVDAQQFSLLRTYRIPPYVFYEMNQRDSVDIDTPDDFRRAAELMEFAR